MATSFGQLMEIKRLLFMDIYNKPKNHPKVDFCDLNWSKDLDCQPH